MVFLTVKMGAKGQIVIPKPLREGFGMAPGDDVLVGEEFAHGVTELVVKSKERAAEEFITFLNEFREKHAVKGFKYDADESYDEMMEEHFSHMRKRIGRRP